MHAGRGAAEFQRPRSARPERIPAAAAGGASRQRRVMSARPLAVPPRRVRMTHGHVQAHAVQIQYSQPGLRPLEDFAGPQGPRRCACLVCGEIHEVAYAEIRNQHHRCFPWCACRQMHGQGLAGTSRSSRPPRWPSEALHVMLPWQARSRRGRCPGLSSAASRRRPADQAGQR